MPYDTIPHPVMISYLIVPYCIRYITSSYHTIPYCIVSYRIISYPILTHHIIWYDIMSYQTMPYCLILYCILEGMCNFFQAWSAKDFEIAISYDLRKGFSDPRLYHWCLEKGQPWGSKPCLCSGDNVYLVWWIQSPGNVCPPGGGSQLVPFFQLVQSASGGPPLGVLNQNHDCSGTISFDTVANGTVSCIIS